MSSDIIPPTKEVLDSISTSYRDQVYQANKKAIENEIKFERMKLERDTLYEQLMKMSNRLCEAKDELSSLKKTYPRRSHVILGDWEEVYSVQDVSANLWTESYPDFHTNTKYYQTFGGGPEGGYFVKDKKVWKVRRSWYNPWSIEELENTILEYEAEDVMAGKTAQCRLIEAIDITETYKINKDHLLWGNCIEIVKCLRDGLGRAGDSEYKDLCLGSILYHFHYLDKVLDLLPKDTAPSYKEVLDMIYKRHQNEEEESEEESGSEKEDSESSDSE